MKSKALAFLEFLVDVTEPLRTVRAVVVLVVVGLVLWGALALWESMHSHPRWGGHWDVRIVVSPRDEVVFNGVGEGGRDLFFLDLTTLQVTRIAATPDYEVDPSLSPDGKTVVYAAGQPGDRADHIFARSLDGGAATQLTRGDANDSDPVFSPDGSLIAFIRDKVFNWGGQRGNWGTTGVVWVMKGDGSGLRQITPDGMLAVGPTFSRDGKTIYFHDDAGTMSAVDVDDAGAVRQLSKMEWFVASAAASPASGLVTFSWTPDSNSFYRIYVANNDGSGQRPLPDPDPLLDPEPALGSWQPAFRHDGKRIVFLRDYWPGGDHLQAKYSLWEVNVDGGNPQKIAGVGLFDDPLHWSSASSK